MPDNPDEDIIHRPFNTERDKPSVQVAEIIADLENKKADELTDMYSCVDGVLNELFSTPPSEEAKMEDSFTYQGYRITIEQTGVGKFVKVSD